MFFFVLNQISTFSILIASIFGMVRYAAMHPVYRPFLFFIWLGAFNDVGSMILVLMGGQNLINSNIYIVFEFLLLLVIFYKWDASRFKWGYISVFLAGCIAWTIENFFIYSLLHINSGFRVLYSMIVLGLSARQVAKITASEKRALLTNAQFQICMCFIFYFSFRAFVEIFYVLQLSFSDTFNLRLFALILFSNLFANIIYAFAILCMPRKQQRSMQ